MRFPAGVLLLAVFGLSVGGCSKGDNNAPAPPASQSSSSAAKASSGNAAAAPLNYVGAAVQGEQKAFKTIDTVSLNEEVQLFNAQEGRYPKSLDELVQKNYLHQLPQPPAGQKIVYDAAQGKVSVLPQ